MVTDMWWKGLACAVTAMGKGTRPQMDFRNNFQWIIQLTEAKAVVDFLNHFGENAKCSKDKPGVLSLEQPPSLHWWTKFDKEKVIIILSHLWLAEKTCYLCIRMLEYACNIGYQMTPEPLQHFQVLPPSHSYQAPAVTQPYELPLKRDSGL